MKDSTIIKLGRLLCGTSLLIVHGVTGMNGSIIAAGIFLLGVPFELVKKK